MAAKTDNICYPVEYWKTKHNTPPAVYAGILTQQGWLEGKSVSEAEYRSATAKFLHSPMGGKG